MTDTDIIKALECCVQYKTTDVRTYKGLPLEVFSQAVLDLINRQKAEIERLKISTSICEYRDVLIDNAKLVRINWENVFIQAVKSEAIREFAEKIKMEFYHEFDESIPSILAEIIDNLVKEMTEDK